MRIFRTKIKAVNFWLDVVVITVVLASLCFIFFWPVRVVGNSMAPTISAGDHLIVSRFMGFFRNYSRGDLVMVEIEVDGVRETAVKRVAGIPFDHIVIDGVGIRLGCGEYFLMGDNADVSRDSRHFGPVSHANITARVILRYLPLNDIEIF